jgi:hypothetical protein
MLAQILNTILGIWLMAAPGILNYNGKAADNDHIIGPVIASFAMIALSGCTRAVGKYNIVPGVWLLLAPWVLNYEQEVAIYNDTCTGLLTIVFSFVKGRIPHQYGGGWTAIWKSDTLHAREAKK